MEIILATEIWGHTVHVDRLADALRPFARRVTVIDPYDGRDPNFSDGEEAYAAYLDQCGHEQYARRVISLLDRATHPVFPIGFSAGAGAVWIAVCRKAPRPSGPAASTAPPSETRPISRRMRPWT